MMTTYNKVNDTQPYGCSAAGFTLFELLIAVLVLAVGLLGLATMQAQGLRSNNSAEQRTEATFLAMDITDRMRSTMTASANKTSPPVIDSAFNAVDTNTVLSCGSCSVVQQDLSDWTTAVRDQLGGGAGSTAWQARIERDNSTGAVVYIVTLMWDDEHTGATGTGCTGGTADMTCFQTLFRP